jgi:hemoglobin-like flavoprotein
MFMERLISFILQAAAVVMIILFLVALAAPDIFGKIFYLGTISIFVVMILLVLLVRWISRSIRTLRIHLRKQVKLPTFQSSGLAVEECLNCGSLYVSIAPTGIDLRHDLHSAGSVQHDREDRMMVRSGTSGDTDHICSTTFLSNISRLESEIDVARLCHNHLLFYIDNRHDAIVFGRLFGVVKQCLGDEEVARMTIDGINEYYKVHLPPVIRAWNAIEQTHVPKGGVLEIDPSFVPGISCNIGTEVILAHRSRTYVPFLCDLIKRNNHIQWVQASNILSVWSDHYETDRETILAACRSLLDKKQKEAVPVQHWIGEIEATIEALITVKPKTL